MRRNGGNLVLYIKRDSVVTLRQSIIRKPFPDLKDIPDMYLKHILREPQGDEEFSNMVFKTCRTGNRVWVKDNTQMTIRSECIGF